MNPNEKIKEELLKRFASMHLVCIGNPDTENEKTTRYLLEILGYIDDARARLGGEYRIRTEQFSIDMMAKEYASRSI